MNTARFYINKNGGTQTSALAASGYTATAAAPAAELWNGTSWTNSTIQTTARYTMYGAASSGSSALIAGGSGVPTGSPTATEEWTQGFATKTITVS